MKERGAEVEFFDLGMVEYAIPAYYVIASAEASSNLSRFDGVKYGYRTPEYEDLHEMYKKSRSEGFGPEVKRRIMLGSFVLSSGYYDAYYLKALRTKALIKKAFDKAFEKYDVILGPAAPTTAPKLGDSLERSDEDVSGRYLYCFGQPGRSSGHFSSVRDGYEGTSDRASDDRQTASRKRQLFGAASAYEKARGAWKLPVMTDKEGR